MNLKKTPILLALFLFIQIILSSTVNAFGASCPYWKDNPLIMLPGETKEIECYLQNMNTEELITLKAEIISGSEIARLKDSNTIYSLPSGKKDIKVPLEIKIPESPNKKYSLSISFKQIPQENKEMLQISSAITSSFEIIINTAKTENLLQSPQQKTEKISLFFALIILIILICISLLAIKISSILKKTF